MYTLVNVIADPRASGGRSADAPDCPLGDTVVLSDIPREACVPGSYDLSFSSPTVPFSELPIPSFFATPGGRNVFVKVSDHRMVGLLYSHRKQYNETVPRVIPLSASCFVGAIDNLEAARRSWVGEQGYETDYISSDASCAAGSEKLHTRYSVFTGEVLPRKSARYPLAPFEELSLLSIFTRSDKDGAELLLKTGRRTALSLVSGLKTRVDPGEVRLLGGSIILSAPICSADENPKYRRKEVYILVDD